MTNKSTVGITKKGNSSNKRRARVSFKGRNYEKTVRTREAERRWKSQVLADLERCPDGVTLQRGKWHSSVETPEGLVARSFIQLDDALKWKSRIESQVEFGTYVSAADKEQTFSEYLPVWEATKFRASPRTMMRYRVLLKNQITPFFGPRKLVAISSRDVENWMKCMMRDGASPQTICKAYDLLKQIFKKAVESHKISRNPVVGIEKPKVASAPRRALTPEELKELAAECGTYKNLVLLLGLTGLRIGEALALQVRDVDLKTMELTVSGAFTYGEDYKTYKSTTKTGTVRQIPIPPVLFDALKESATGRPDWDYLFLGSRGGALDYSYFTKAIFRKAVKRLGLENVTVHSLRHTCASLLISGGAPVTVVARILGHSSVVMTLNIYGHYYKDDLRDSIAHLSASFEP